MPFRRGLRVIVIATLVAATGTLLSLPKIGFGLEEERGLSWLFQLRGPRAAPPEAVLVRFDRDAFARLRNLPENPAEWPQPLADCAARQGGIPPLSGVTGLDRLPRGVLACLVEELTKRGAAVVAFDVSFRRDPGREAGVPALATAIRAHGGVVVLSLALRQLAQVSGQPSTQADSLEGPHPLLAQAAIGTASWTLPRGSSQIHQFWTFNAALPASTQLPVRALEVLSLPALIRLAQSTEEPVPLSPRPAEVLSRFTDWFRAQIAADGGLTHAELAALSPADAATLLALRRVYRGSQVRYINFYGPPGTVQSYSAADLLMPEGNDAVPVAALRGRVVFVGYQELDIPQAQDSFPTAFRSLEGVDLAGVEIAATAFGNLLHDESLRVLPEWARLLLVGALGFALALASCLGTVWRGLVLTLALGAAYVWTAAASFVVANLWLPFVVPALVLVPLAIGIGQAVHYFGAARWLGVYTPRQVSRRLLEGGDFARSAQMREVTVMLTDIVGFTAMAEQSSPDEVTAFVNRHFTMLDRCVEAEGGTLAQFIGDSVMSFWGAPDPQPDHAARACRAALAIAAVLAAENRRRAGEGHEPVRMRIGINTGMVTAGNVGAPGRSNYGIVGDTVNTTQRIEQLAKVICPDEPTAAILVSARTRKLAGPSFSFREAGAHQVRGRSQTVMIYQLEGHAAGASASSAADRSKARNTLASRPQHQATSEGRSA